MRKVVDSNFLQREELRDFLSSSPHNFAVLTDYAAMEAYKGDSLASIYRSMEILADHPKQVVVLKGTQVACGLKARSAGLQRRLIDEKQTLEFGRYCQHLRAGKRGNLLIQNRILDFGREATAHMDRILADAVNLPDVFRDLAKSYTGAELKIFRTEAEYTPEMIDKIFQTILMLAISLFNNHPRCAKLPNIEEIHNTFIFRNALCAHQLFLRWISEGSQMNIRPEKIRNDIVDINFATFATYFDGLLTADKKLTQIYREAVFLLRTVFIPITT